jgi:hypothetical protein
MTPALVFRSTVASTVLMAPIVATALAHLSNQSTITPSAISGSYETHFEGI